MTMKSSITIKLTRNFVAISFKIIIPGILKLTPITIVLIVHSSQQTSTPKCNSAKKMVIWTDLEDTVWLSHGTLQV